MGRDKRNEARGERFVKAISREMGLPAWKALTFSARSAYLQFKIRCMAETAQSHPKVQNNNGLIFLSCRDLAEELGCSKTTAQAAVADLQAKGWIVVTKTSRLGSQGRGTAASYRLTMLPMGAGSSMQPATREPERWAAGDDYPVVEYPNAKPRPRRGFVQKTEPRPEVWDTRVLKSGTRMH